MPNILIIGLDNAGKTTMTQRLLETIKQPHKSVILPTIALETYSFKHNKKEFKLFDLGGSGRFRSYWNIYSQEADTILIVIDSQDRDTFFVCRENLTKFAEKLTGKSQKIRLIFNKKDLDDAVSSDKLNKLLGLDDIFKGSDISIFDISALKNDGIQDLAKNIFQ